jgi:two-component system sensor histidine kinase/response regulator
MLLVPHRDTQPGEVPSRRRILIVDDNSPTARGLAVLIGGGGFDTSIALRGADALDQVSAGNDFAAAIVDIHLPDISGLIVTQKLREMLGPDVPIIILSGDTSMTTLNSLSHVGATYFFSKPVNSTQLMERLKEWVGEGSQQ